MNKIPIFVINLKRDSAKKQQIQTMLNKLNLEFNLFEAVDGAALSEGKIATIYDKSNPRLKRQLSNGELGCAFSHLHIYQKMID
ncbi:MAG: glycosyltransferase family 25 protein, partial [Candidatus Thioglobus sp.]